MRILVTGGNGYIAKAIYSHFNNIHDLTLITRKDFDLVDSLSTTEWFLNKKYDIVIHTAAVGGSRLQQDSDDIIQQNLKMIVNLYENKHSFNKLITFGSGAEIFFPNTPYGISKKMIAEVVNDTDAWYNLRIFGVFDHNELNTRFIKSNILRYLNKESILIHTDKIMDFIYMEDLMLIIDHYINNNNLSKLVNCSYKNKVTLTNIADHINTLDNHRVPVIIENPQEFKFYCGSPCTLQLNYFGLQEGIINTFNYLK